MKSVAAARVALVLGLVAGACLTPSVSVGGIETLQPGGETSAAIDAEQVLLAQADAAMAERPVSYSLDQADRGEGRYESDCEECHGDDLKGGLNGGPPLRGLMFEENYADGLPASLLFAFMSTQMPPNAPGRYPPSTYADVMAYILKQNGFQPGAPLPSDMDELEQLIMVK